MPNKIFKIMFPKVTKQQLENTENNIIVFKTYNKTSIQQLGICSTTVKHKMKKNYADFL